MNRCWICNKPIDSDESLCVCDESYCQREQQEMIDDQFRSYETIDREACEAAVIQRAKCADLEPGRIRRWWYTWKFLVCVMLRLNDCQGDYYDNVMVAEFNYQKLYAGWSCEYAMVGRGILSGWWYHIESDGEWWM